MAGSKVQPIRGFHDLLPETARAHHHVIETAARWAARFGYEPMATPIMEATAVFARSLGETSDVVSKEMYAFTDKGGDDITLRPEGTAGAVRALIANGLTQTLPQKWFYEGPMFRRERPQKGRQRQFHQIGVEFLGGDGPAADVEVIALGMAVLGALDLAGTLTLTINSLGDAESRAAYRDALVSYLSRYDADLSEDSRHRLSRNPLRILDSKDEGDKRIVAEAPLLGDHLNDLSRAHMDAVRQGLSDLSLPFVEDPRLVRGLDYYAHTAFEVISDGLGSQGTVLAGGRYDGLVQQMGGPPVPAVGWAAGMERLVLLRNRTPPKPVPVALVPMGEAAERAAARLAMDLRCVGLVVDLLPKGNVKKRMQRADRIGAVAAVILGEEELAAGTATVKALATGEQATVPAAGLFEHVRGLGAGVVA